MVHGASHESNPLFGRVKRRHSEVIRFTPSAIREFIGSQDLELTSNPVSVHLSHSYRELFKRYAWHLKLINFAPASVGVYAREAAEFLAWLTLDANISDIRSIAVEHIRNYERVVLSRTRIKDRMLLSPQSRAAKIDMLRHFFKFMRKKEILSHDYGVYLDRPRTRGVRICDTLSESEMQKLADLPAGSRYSRDPYLELRDRAMIELMYSTGIRNSELRNITVSDLNFQDHQVVIRYGKGGKDRILPLGAKAVNAIEEYLINARSQLSAGPEDPTGTLFLTRRGKKIDIGMLTRIFKKNARKAGIAKNVYAHMIRHSFATHMLNNDCDLRYIQAFLGHARLDTTEIYTHVSIEKLKAIHPKTHPRENHVAKVPAAS